MIGKSKASLDTPCLVLDKSLLLNNLRHMQQEVKLAKKQLRPHAKTHKCSAICQLQLENGAVGISVAKVSEALVLAEKSIKNILITSPVVTPLKIQTLIKCLALDPQLSVVIDNLENAYELNKALQAQQLTLRIIIDIDAGIGRTGIAVNEILQFATALQKFSSLRLVGIQCYAGNLQHITSYQEREAASRAIMLKAAHCRQQLIAAGFPCEILTGSGTGTYAIDIQIPEVTEVQPGSYTVMDTEYSIIDHIKYQPALRLLTSIISVNQTTHVTCDAGWKALYEVSTKPRVLHPENLVYAWGGFGDEHGKITAINNAALPKLGERLEIMVAHCDPTINMYDVFYVLENDVIVDIWPIDMRGKSQ